MSELSVTIESMPGRHLFGLSVQTDLERAALDCPELWKRFVPLMPALSGKQCPEFAGESYGVSIMHSHEESIFTYFAGMEPAPGVSLPEECTMFSLPAGLYARCRVPSLDALEAGYRLLYEEWAAKNGEYTVNMAASCFERYGKEYLDCGALELFVPVLKA